MLELFKNFSIEQIIIFIVLLALAIKGCVSFIDWIVERNKKTAIKLNQPVQFAKNIERHDEQIKDIKDSLSNLSDKIDLLISSDRDDIKAFITREHHYFCYQKGWIDDYSLDCIEKRYAHYKQQGGNSFIANLMSELRALPKEEIKGG